MFKRLAVAAALVLAAGGVYGQETVKPPKEEAKKEAQEIKKESKAQADLLRARRFGDLDLEHLIEEVDDLGESLYRSARAHPEGS